jgi:hypothetical protein
VFERARLYCGAARLTSNGIEKAQMGSERRQQTAHLARAALNPFVIRNNTVYYLCIVELQAAELVELDFSCIIIDNRAESAPGTTTGETRFH